MAELHEAADTFDRGQAKTLLEPAVRAFSQVFDLHDRTRRVGNTSAVRPSGRGDEYGDHWQVVTGFSSDGQTVYLNDPDNQGARDGFPGWIVGGQITLPLSTFRTAAYNAAPGAPYGIVVD